MNTYRINEIYADGYERFAVVERIGQKTKLNIHFLEYDEYLENGAESEKKKKGDILEGDISIDLVTCHKKVEKALSYDQKIQKSPHIEAVVEVTQVIDMYSLYALSAIAEDNILVEFENAVDYKIGEKVLITGTLELDEKE